MIYNKTLQVVLSAKSREILIKGDGLKVNFSNTHLGAHQHRHHITLFHPQVSEDAGVFESLAQTSRFIIIPTGIVRTSYVIALAVVIEHVKSNQVYQYQACGRKPLHITLGCAPDVGPSAANDAFASQPVQPVAFCRLTGSLALVDC